MEKAENQVESFLRVVLKAILEGVMLIVKMSFGSYGIKLVE
jgi:hypothetical protein